MNKKGVIFSLAHLDHYVLPGFLAGCLGAILHAVGEGTFGNFTREIGHQRSYVGQGAFQLIGIALSIGIGLLAGVILGLISMCLNRNNMDEQFNDNAIYKTDKKVDAYQER